MPSPVNLMTLPSTDGFVVVKTTWPQLATNSELVGFLQGSLEPVELRLGSCAGEVVAVYQQAVFLVRWWNTQGESMP